MKLADSPFQKGLYARVPKGTPLVSRWGHQRDKTETTNREVVVEISDVALPAPDTMLSEEEKAERTRRLSEIARDFDDKRQALSHDVEYPSQTINPGTPHAYTRPAYTRSEIRPENEAAYQKLWKAMSEADNEVIDEYKKLGESRFSPDDVLVGWSSNNKWAEAKNLEIAEKPESRKKQPKVNIRQQMVDKSRWKFTHDVDIYYGAPNPVFNRHIAAWDKANPRPERPPNIPHNASEAAYQDWEIKEAAFSAAWQKHGEDRQAMRQAAEKSLGEYTPVLYRSIKAGEVFTVQGKFNTYFHPHGWHGQKYTNTAVVQFDGESEILGLEYSMIKDFIELESIPTVDVWVLRYKPSGAYYKAPDYRKGNFRWKNHYEDDANDDKSVDYQEMVDTFMKGKKWDNLGRAKTSILMMTGYYDGLPGAGESLPEWGSGGKTFHMTEDWELVQFDKLGRQEIGPVADFHKWFKRSWELRELTVKYGSSVRTAYQALEKANLLDSQKGMVVFTETDEEKLDNAGYHGDKTAISDEEKALIDAAIASTQMKKGTFKKAVDIKSVAVTFPNKGAAMMFKLAYNGKLKTTILDLETLTEAVDG
jgi:hypothetical protein